MSDNYAVLPISTHLGEIRDKENNELKPFVAIYFPDEILKKMKWTRETNLLLSVEKDCLKIVKAGSDREDDYFVLLGELTYEPDCDEN